MNSNLNENEFATKLTELLGKYDLECQTKKDSPKQRILNPTDIILPYEIVKVNPISY